MHRICNTLAKTGYDVELVGRLLPHSIALKQASFRQTRLRCWFHKGKIFYLEYNFRLFIYLVSRKCSAYSAVDLDTLLAAWAASIIRKKKLFFDAHEYFTETPEVQHRGFTKSIWSRVARMTIPSVDKAYTVGSCLAEIFQQQYHIPFVVIRNMPSRQPLLPYIDRPLKSPFILLYQGALNKGRGLPQLLQSMVLLGNGFELWLAGEGDLSDSLKLEVKSMNLHSKVKFLGYLSPHELVKTTPRAHCGLNLLDNQSKSYYYSLANKCFDYIQAGIPCLTMDFPEYYRLNREFEVFSFVESLDPQEIVQKITALRDNEDFYNRLCMNCRKAGTQWVWENEAQKLLEIYSGLT